MYPTLPLSDIEWIMTEGMSKVYTGELSMMQQRFEDLQYENDCLKIQNEISSLERQIESMELSRNIAVIHKFDRAYISYILHT